MCRTMLHLIARKFVIFARVGVQRFVCRHEDARPQQFLRDLGSVFGNIELRAVDDRRFPCGTRFENDESCPATHTVRCLGQLHEVTERSPMCELAPEVGRRGIEV